MTAAPTDLDRSLVLHPLTFSEDGDEVTVGRPDTGSYGVFPADGAALLQKLVDGLSPRVAVAWYADTYGESVDIEEFLEVLDEFEFIVHDGETPAERLEVRWQGLGAALFSPVAWALYAVLTAAAVVMMWRIPEVAPHYRNLFFTNSLVVLQLGLFFTQIPFVLLHEVFHALAGRRLGLRSRVGIGRRFYFLVFETSLDGLVAVPRRKRYLPLLAGMLCDVLVISSLTLVAVWLRDPDGTVTGPGRLCLAMAFATLLRLSWQSYLFLRTDIYYLVTTVIGCNDLHTVAGQMVRNTCNRALGRHDRLVPESAWHPRDRAVARWYSWLLVAGYVFLAISLAAAIVPAVVVAVEMVISRLQGHPTALGLLDVVVFLVLTIGQLVFAAVLAYRSRRPAGRRHDLTEGP